jgi:hypothetical protein
MIDNLKWLTIKADVYNKYKHLPPKTETFDIRVDAVEAGWFDMFLSVSGREYKVVLSSFPEPFIGIRQWLEDIVVCTDRLGITLNVDCDTQWNTLFHIEHLTSYEKDEVLFYLYDTTEDDYLSGYLDLEQFVRVFYTTILNYALEGEKTESFQQNWLEYFSDEEYPDGLLSSAFRSEIIETYLVLKNRYETRRKFTND